LSVVDGIIGLLEKENICLHTSSKG
jgi:hypothetical protein